MANTKVTVDQAIRAGEKIVYHTIPHPGYSMENRLGPNSYDCSGFMATIWSLVKYYNVAPTTGEMAEEYPKYGFDLYRYGSISLKKGDILVHPTVGENIGHTAMVYDDSISRFIESHGGFGPDVRAAYWLTTGYWKYVLRGNGGFYIDKWQPTDGSRGFHH